MSDILDPEVTEIETPEVEKKAKKTELDGFYKGYDIKWLAKEDQANHPDRGLVDEYNKKYGKVGK